MQSSGLRAKSIFLASISHEIRTPLSAILGASEILENTELAENQNAFVNIIKKSSLNLNVIISDILNLTKLEYSQVNFNLEAINITKLIEEVLQVQYSNQNFKKDQIEFAYELSPDLPLYIKTDSTRLKQILNNLFYNALKFTKSGSISIYVKLKESTHNSKIIHFEVKDTGMGIPTDKLNALFDQFSQVDSSNKHGHGGVGLGLYICKVLVSKFNGKIWVESEKEKGSSFHFTIKAENIEDSPSLTDEFKSTENNTLHLGILKKELNLTFHNFSKIIGITEVNEIHDIKNIEYLIKNDIDTILVIDNSILETINKVDLIGLDRLKILVILKHYDDIDKTLELIEAISTLPKPIKFNLFYRRLESFKLSIQ